MSFQTCTTFFFFLNKYLKNIFLCEQLCYSLPYRKKKKKDATFFSTSLPLFFILEILFISVIIPERGGCLRFPPFSLFQGMRNTVGWKIIHSRTCFQCGGLWQAMNSEASWHCCVKSLETHSNWCITL